MIGRLLLTAALAVTISLPARPASAITFTVTTAADTADDSNDGLCLDAFGECSLRAAITEANRTAEYDSITFAIPGGGTSTIDLVTSLPTITKPLNISSDGNYHLVVTTTHGVGTGFDFAPGSDSSALYYLVIGGFGTGVHVAASSVQLYALRIGSNALGNTAVPNTLVGVSDEGFGTSLTFNGICSSPVGLLLGGSSTGLSSNIIGSCDGLADILPNGTGIVITGGSGSTSTNYVVGNSGDGIRVTGASSGWSLNSLQIYQNGGDGIRFEDTANNNSVTGDNIHDNAGAGIAVRPGARNNRFSSLIMKNNGGLGIDLLEAGNATGVTLNDAADADTGANDRQNYPAGKAGTGFSTMRILSGGTIIQGGLNSVPNRTFTIEYYQSPSCDPNGFGEGEQLVGTASTTGCTEVTTDATGYVDIGCQLPTAIQDGWFVTALVTGEGGTSEFSQCASLATSVSTTSTSMVGATSSTSSSTSLPTSSSTSSSSSTTHSTTSTAVPTTSSSSTPSTSTTTKTSTTLAGSTTSSSTLPAGTTSSSTTTITATTFPNTTQTNPPTTSSSTSSSTSTTLSPSCGDGTITAPEQCDPAVAGSQGCCNPVTCLPFSAGTTCGLERDPCGAPVCDGAGSCITRPALLNIRCREAGAVGPCDPGAVCGAEPYCPNADTATGCEALDFSLAANAAKFKFRCKAKSAAKQAVKCAADLVGQPGSALIARRRAANLEAVPTSDCTGPQFDTTLPKKLAKFGRDDLARIIVARINKDDRGYFASGKTVCVRVRFTASNGYSQTRLYDVTVP